MPAAGTRRPPLPVAFLTLRFSERAGKTTRTPWPMSFLSGTPAGVAVATGSAALALHCPGLISFSQSVNCGLGAGGAGEPYQGRVIAG